MAPEQVDPATLHGYFSGTLAHTSIIAGAISGVGPPKGLRETWQLIQKAMCPDTKSVRYVGDLCAKSIAQHELMGRIVTTVVHGGLPGSSHLAHPQFRIDNWGRPGDIAALVVRRLTKRGILLAVCEFVAKIPCHVTRAIVPVTFTGSVAAAVFSPRSRAAKLVATPREALRIDPPLSLGTPVPILAKADPQEAADAFVRMATPFSTAAPRNAVEMAALQLAAARSRSMGILPAHPSVRKYQMDRFGEILVPLCQACRTLLVPTGSRSKTRRVAPVMLGGGSLVCSGCNSRAIARINMAGLVARIDRGGKEDVLCPCSECGVLGPIGGVRGLLPYCARHAAVEDIEPEAHCAICRSRIHGDGVKYVEVASKRYECICSACQTVFPVRTAPSRRGAHPLTVGTGDEMDGGRIQSASSVEEQSAALRAYVKDVWTCKGVAIQATGRRCFTVRPPRGTLPRPG